jgi:hypothetical protein
MTLPAEQGWKAGGGKEALSERDLAILRDFGLVRLLTGHHVQRLHFGDGSPLTQARRSRSTLQRLCDAGWLVRLDRRVGGVHAGSAGLTFSPSARAQRLLTKRGPAGGRRLRRPWEPSAAFTDHVLTGSELYVRLRELEASGSIEELRFESEPICWRYWLGPSGERLVVKPDAFVSFLTNDYDHALLIEVDRGSQSRTVIRNKGRIYVDYFHSGSEQHRTGYFPRVVFITTDDDRRAVIVDALAGLDAEDWQLFQVQTMAEAFVDGWAPPP